MNPILRNYPHDPVEREAELRKASHYPAGHNAIPSRDRTVWDEERTKASSGAFPTLGVAHAGQTVGELRRRARDSIPAREVVTSRFIPNPWPGRPPIGASSEDIKAYNAHVEALDPKDRPPGLPSYWYGRNGKLILG